MSDDGGGRDEERRGQYRVGRGRTPDPNRPGTVYRAGPRLGRRRSISDGPPYLTVAPPPAPDQGFADDYAPMRDTELPVDDPHDPAGRYGDDYRPGAYDEHEPGYGGYDRHGQPQPGPVPYADGRDVPSNRYPYGEPERRLERPGRGLGTGLPTRRRRLRLRPGLLVILVVLALIAYPILLGMTAWTNLNRVDAIAPAHAGTEPADTPGRTFLVVGSDSRDNLSAEERKKLGTGKVAGRRTDTIMLLHVPAAGGPTVLVSVPRDSYVSIPGRGKNKINAAYAFGGPTLLVQTLEQATGLRIDDYVETGLSGFANIVDAVGGVRICPKFDMDDKDAHINLKKGCQEADGTTALGYARARKSDPRGDLGRVERQREVLAAIASKTLSPGTLVQPWRAFPAAKNGGAALTIDKETSPLAVVRFVMAMRTVSGGGGIQMTVPISNPNLSTSAGSAVQWDRQKALQLFDGLKTNDESKIEPLADEQAKEAAARSK
jgi:LCP family protein required for cell wall assembly